MAKLYGNDPVGWIHKFISFKGLAHEGLTWQQKEIAENVVKHHFLCVAAGGGIGKSAVVAMLILWFLATHPGARIPATAPNGAQLHDVLFAELAKWLERCAMKSMFTLTKGRLQVVNQREWYCVARTVRKDLGQLNGTLSGFHSGYMMIVVDEAAEVPDPVFTALDGALTGENSYIILISNPISYGGYFFDTIEDPTGTGFKVLQYSSKDSPLVTEAYAKRIAARYGEDSAMYKAKVLGETVAAINYAVVDPKTFEKIVSTQRDLFDGNRVVGIDVGGAGKDLTVLCHRVGWSICRWDTLTGETDTLLEQTGEIITNMYGDKPVTIIPDAIGEGSGFTSLLPHYVPPTATVMAYKGSKKAADVDMYANNRSAIFHSLHKNFGKLHFPVKPPERLKKELANLIFVPHSNQIEIEAKKKFYNRLGFSPDNADALAETLFVNVSSMDKHIKVGTGARSIMSVLDSLGDSGKYGKYGMFV